MITAYGWYKQLVWGEPATAAHATATTPTAGAVPWDDWGASVFFRTMAVEGG